MSETFRHQYFHFERSFTEFSFIVVPLCFIPGHFSFKHVAGGAVVPVMIFMLIVLFYKQDVIGAIARL